jgi:hypothetical protein
MNFEPRFPLDHVMALVKSVREETATLSSTLQLSGQILGEVGALVGSTSFTSSDSEVPVTLDGCLDAIDALVSQMSVASADPQFDITPFIPLIIKVIELLLARRGQ